VSETSFREKKPRCGEVARKWEGRIADADGGELGKSTPFLDQFGDQNGPKMVKNGPKMVPKGGVKKL